MRGSRWISGGYVVVRRTHRPDEATDRHGPAATISVCDDLCPVLPSVPAGWLEAYDAPPGRFAADADDRLGKLLWALASDLERFGLESARAVATMEWLATAAGVGDFLAPSLFASPDAARRFARFVGAEGDDVWIVGLALPAELRDRLCDPAGSVHFLSELLRRDESPRPGGTELGYEVLEVEDDQLRSWLVGGLGRRAIEELHVGLSESGLLRDLADAHRVAEWANQGAGTEPPGHWAPWRLQRYA